MTPHFKLSVRPSRVLVSLAVSIALAGCPTTYVDDDDSAQTGPFAYDDTDGDLIIDVHEGYVDYDNDQIPNHEDTDSDGDGIADRIEGGDDDPLTLPVDSDEDGQADFLDIDSDNNGIPDQFEAGDTDLPLDSDGDGTPDFADADNDGDGISDSVEIGLNPSIPLDSDSDGTPDYLDDDSDADGVPDSYEAGTGPFQPNPRDTDGDGTPDYLDQDADGDGFSDSEEHFADDDGVPRDLDDDGVFDFLDTDSDGDGLRDDEETSTDPYDADSDGDGFTDGAEVLGGSDPNNSTSHPDGIYVIVEERSTVEEVFTFETELDVGDVFFLLDTTCSMSGTLSTMASNFSTVVTNVAANLSNVAFGVGSYDDYNDASFGSSLDRPYFLNQQMTDDTALVQAALSALVIHSGADGPESSHEALFQAATGIGYDQDCDSTFDTEDDVRPFIPSTEDRFSGGVPGHYDATVPGTGTIGGAGFRPYSLPIIVYVTDNRMRDPDAGDPTPVACSLPAGRNAVIEAVNDIGGKLIGVDVGSQATPQMILLAEGTESIVDLDADGDVDDYLVFAGTNAVVVTAIVDGIAALVETGEFDVTLEVANDIYGFVTNIQPAEGYPEVPAGTSLTFTLTFAGVQAASTDDQLYLLDLNVVGDGSTLLDQKQIIVVVPGTG